MDNNEEMTTDDTFNRIKTSGDTRPNICRYVVMWSFRYIKPYGFTVRNGSLLET